MIIHLPTGKKFHNRKEAKIYFGTAYYYRMEREKKDLMFTNTIQSDATLDDNVVEMNEAVGNVKTGQVTLGRIMLPLTSLL
jgi:hypothetical protein